MNNIIYVNHDPNNNIQLNIIELEKDHLKQFYKILQCDHIDIIRLKVETKYFDFIIDDIGKWEHKEPTAFIYKNDLNNYLDYIAGDCLITQVKKETGETIPLTNEEIEFIKSHFIIAKYEDYKSNQEKEALILFY